MKYVHHTQDLILLIIAETVNFPLKKSDKERGNPLFLLIKIKKGDNNKMRNIRFIKSIACTIEGTSPNEYLEIKISNQELKNNCLYDLVLCQNKPYSANDLPVKLKDGSVIIPVLKRNGNMLHADEISSRKKYTFVYGDDTEHILIINNICECHCNCNE